MKKYTAKMDKISLVREPSGFERIKIGTSSDAKEFAMKIYDGSISIYESMFIILMNTANIATGYVKLSQGGIIGTVVDKMLVTKYAIDSLSKNIILVHNHPSGNINPSTEDLNVTTEVQKCLKLFNIKLIDHIVISPEGKYYSMADEGQL